MILKLFKVFKLQSSINGDMSSTMSGFSPTTAIPIAEDSVPQTRNTEHGTRNTKRETRNAERTTSSPVCHAVEGVP